jgi:hypothetical protein
MYNLESTLNNINPNIAIQGITVPIENVVSSINGILYLGNGTDIDTSFPIGRNLSIDVLDQ